MPVQSGPGGPARYSIPYTGGYHAPQPYAGGYSRPALNPGMATMFAMNPMHVLQQMPWVPFPNPFQPFPEPEYRLSEEELPVAEHFMHTVSAAEQDPPSKEVTALTDDLTAACATGKITI